MTDFKIISDKEHVLKRPNMYVGSVSKESLTRFVSGQWRSIAYVPGLIKIVNEVIDNSIDEAIRTGFKFANEITVSIDENRIKVTDNGRGIPQDLIEDLDGSKILRPVAAWTRTKAGSNFDDDRVTIGMNGVGAALTNFLSFSFIGVTSDGKNKLTVSCSNNADRVFTKTVKSKDRGTSVEFVPDFSRFGVFGVSKQDVSIIQDRIESLAVCYPEIKFKFNNKRVQGNLKKYSDMYDGKYHFTHENVSVFFAPSKEFLQNSFVNGVQTVNGGVHVNYFIDRLCEQLLPMIKKKHKVDVSKALFKNSLMLGMFIRNFQNPKFDSQTKEALTNTQAEISPYLKDIPYDKIAKRLMTEDDIIQPAIEALVAKQLAAEARELKKQQKNQGRKRVEGHIKSSKPGGTLFLVEGKSAMGFLLKTRNKEKHGGYPLRGKVLNTYGMTPYQIMKNKELADIVGITGLTVGDTDISNMTWYNDIAIMTDADVDGKGSIYPLLLCFFYNWPELFKAGRIKFCKSPIIIAEKGKESKWFYDLDSFTPSKYKSWNIRYIKGLGSLTEKEYKRVINEPVFDTVQIDDPGCFEIMFGDDADKRKVWMTK